MPSFMRSRAALLVSAGLLLQAALMFASIRPEIIPFSLPLSNLPNKLASWTGTMDVPVEQEVLDVLKADDLLYRIYNNGSKTASLFVAGFKSQRNGKTPHSPKNCLPGSGWLPVSNSVVTVDTQRGKIPVNRYIIVYGNRRQLVLYWYQSRDRAVASEYEAKLWVMMDSMRLNRTDTALVRVITDVSNGDEADADRFTTDFIRSFYNDLLNHLPA